MFVRYTTIRWALIVASGLLLTWPLFNTYGLKAQAVPALTILSPTDGATVDGPVTVRVQHSGIVFDGVKIGQAPEPGVGHWHVNIDGQYAGLAVSNVLEIPNDAFPTISAGEHTITVDLHQNNHAATDPPVVETFQINASQELSAGTSAGASGAAGGSPAHGTGTNAPAGGTTPLPNTGRDGADRTLAILAVLVLMAIGLLVVYVNGRSRTRARSDR